ncbi:APC family permease [Staphylococcus simiae]|uniref:Amino acid permease n=1 Tax=Staphylococcus simiae CCM 7213 = CCUG 51256 TaxID=911238 RepID=G5JIF4_9STAP|nr:amino acid permease [Staphylococcus simiae]EHJ08045.1 Amino acid permease [Staphylococcus simiae CCM 7213 = CCUG 51256]SNV58106.1 amino acid permease [Staphylococcus simiae]
MGNDTELKKSIGFFAALSLVMGTVIGSGVFFKVSNVTEVTGSTSMAMFVWFLGGIVTICAGLTGAELAAAIPETGGLTKYIEYTYGDFWGFLSGWAQAFIYFPANIAALAIIFATQIVNLFHLQISLLIPIAFISALTIVLINFLGSKAGGILQSITLVIKFIPIALIVIIGIFSKQDVQFSLFPIVNGTQSGFFTAIGSGLLATMFAYDGWIHVGNIAGELKNPKKDLPAAITIGIGLIMVIYLLINATFLMTLPISQVAGNLNAASDASAILFGASGGKLVTIGILISVYGTMNGYIMTSMRIPYAMAKNHRLPFEKFFLSLTPSRVPWTGGIVQLVIASIMMLLGAFDTITNMLIFVIWTFYSMAFVAVIILRKREPELQRPYKVPLYPIVPGIALIAGVFVLVNTLFTQPLLACTGIVITLLGVPIYYYKKRQTS